VPLLERSTMSLYKKILRERIEEERRRGRPLGAYRGIDSVVIDRLSGEALNKPPGYMTDIFKLHYFVHHGPSSSATGMWFGSLRNKYPEEYGLLKAEREGELYEQQEMFGET
jgi:hypothetical protein